MDTRRYATEIQDVCSAEQRSGGWEVTLWTVAGRGVVVNKMGSRARAEKLAREIAEAVATWNRRITLIENTPFPGSGVTEGSVT